ncbi:hypothetical protein JX266_007465 [Neoarthrinium moseri]|nr:hypothetical protein JX266_007465 [Neoarthrinium moseri]
MSTPQVVRVAISPVVTSTPASYKRRVVPSAEAYASKRSLILTTPTKRPAKQGNRLSVERFYPKNLFLRDTANIVEEFVHGHAAPAREDENKAAWHIAAEADSYFEKNIPKLEFIELMPLLPGKIAGCPSGYLRDHELHRPPWTDRKPKQPIAPQPVSGVVDRTAYDTLRPGVMISSSKLVEHGHPSELSTSSGVLVKDPHGNQFMTATSHGIGQNTTVFQTGRPERTIGKAAIDVAFTDIALVDLARDVVFENETFESNGTAPKFTRLAKSTDPVRMGHDCYLNSPYTGHLDGIIMMKSVKLEAAVSFEAQKRYIIYNWAWMGQGGTRIPDGTCGSAIWDSDGVVLGFFHFYIEQGPWAGHAASVSASELEANESEGRAGWVLAV